MLNLTTGVREENILFSIIGLQKQGALKTCTEYLNNKNLTPKLKKFLESIKVLLESVPLNIKKIEKLFDEFYTEHLTESGIKTKDFKKLFLNISYFNKVNNYLIKKIFNKANKNIKILNNKLKETLPTKIGRDINGSNVREFFNLFSRNDRVILNEFIQEVSKHDSDYYPGVYSTEYQETNKTETDFSGLPTRVYYGLCLQWDEYRINWKEKYGHDYKESTITNKKKFEYLIEHKPEKLKHIANRLNECTFNDILELLENIINIDKLYAEYNWLTHYYIRAYLLFKFLKNHGANIRRDSNNKPFLKKIHVKNPKTGRYVQHTTEGTFLSIFYDIYFDETKPKRRTTISTKSRVRDEPRSPRGVDNILSKSSSNSVSVNSNNNKSMSSSSTSNKKNNVEPNNKFSPRSPKYNLEFPKISHEKTTKK